MANGIRFWLQLQHQAIADRERAVIVNTPIKPAPIGTISSQWKFILPGKCRFRNPKLFLIVSQILVIKVVKAISASNVIPRAHLGFVPLSLRPFEFGTTNGFWRGTTQYEK